MVSLLLPLNIIVSGPGGHMHQIKKYANRKMYDMTDKRYISMAQLTELIKSGAEVAVVDNQTGSSCISAAWARQSVAGHWRIAARTDAIAAQGRRYLD